MDLREASHLDPETLLQLRGIAHASAGLAGTEQLRVTRDEPAELNTINGLELAGYLDGRLDPAATVRALSDAALGELADTVYRHLFVADGPAEDELAAGLPLA